MPKPTRLPNAKCGKRALPPPTGLMPPSSACTNASSITAAAPTTHEMIAAGPAIFVAFSEPSSQPEPMTDPTEVKRSAVAPMSRRRRPLGFDSLVAGGAGAVLAVPIRPMYPDVHVVNAPVRLDYTWSVRVLVLAPGAEVVHGSLRRPLQQERVVWRDERIGGRHRVRVVDGPVVPRERDPARCLAQPVLELRANLPAPVL